MSKHRPETTPIEIKLLIWSVAFVVVIKSISQFTTLL